jgi:membrane protein DedA with SNARE-associated domain
VEGLGALGGFIATYGLVALFVVMLAKESGIPVPIPSDLLMIAAGAQAALGAFGLPELALAMLVAVAVGMTVQFLLLRRVGRAVLERFGPRVGLQPERLDRAAAKLRSAGPAGLFIGLNLPGARAGIVAAAALTGMAYGTFAPAAITGAATFHAWHVALGFLVGPTAVALLGSVNLWLAIALVGLALVGVIGWILVRSRQGVAERESTKASGPRQWTEAACPACLAAALLENRALW